MKVDGIDRTKVLITGASGFIGSALCDALKNMHQFEVLGIGRSRNSEHVDIVIPDFDTNVPWGKFLDGVDVVIHCAAMLQDSMHQEDDTHDSIRKINVEGSAYLAMQSKLAGVKRFIFLSSSKVNGESTRNNSSYNEESLPNPDNEYARSKWDAEVKLRSISNSMGFDIVVIRPPLVYGPAVKANFHSLLRLAYSGLPLPLGSIKNHRSMIFIGNLVDFIVVCTKSPAAANQLFLVADSSDISTADLIRVLRQYMGIPTRLIPVPVLFLRGLASMLGKSGYAERLLGNFQIDSTKAKQMIGWTPPYSQEQGLGLTAQYFIATEKSKNVNTTL